MAQTSIGATPIIYPLGLGASSSLLGELGSVWDVALNGKGYLLSTLDQESPFEYRALTIQPASTTRPRIDTSPEPGEQTLDQWWVRAQHSWHRGAGQTVFDSEESIRFRFENSKGLNIWEEGQIGLLKDTFLLDSGAFTDYKLLADAGVLLMAENGILNKIPDLDDHPGSSTTHNVGGPGAGSSTVQSITSDGKYVYVCWDPAANAGIRRVEIGAVWPGAVSALVNDLDPELIEFAKNRLICSKDNKLYQIIDLAITTAPTEFFTNIYESWLWTGITGASTGIYCSGYAGSRSEIFHIGLDSSTLGSGALLNAPRSVWEAPEGEVIHTIKGYLGVQLLIGTSRGVRVGNIDETGNLTVTAVLVETPSPIKAFDPKGDYTWFGWSNFDATSSGIGRLHLGRLDHASDLMYSVQGSVVSIAELNDRMVFAAVDIGTNVVVAEHATDYIASGFFESGEIRFGTFEEKILQFFDGLTTGDGTLDVEVARNLEAYVQVIYDAPVGQANEKISVTSTRFRIKVTLNRSVTTTTSFNLLEWRLRADPLLPSRLIYHIPIMVYDFIQPRNSHKIGYKGYADERREELFNLYRTQASFFIQLPNGLPIKVRMESAEFKSYTPPEGASGLGGIFLAVMKEQD